MAKDYLINEGNQIGYMDASFDTGLNLVQKKLVAGADIQKKSAELMQPIIEKANKAVQEVAKAGGYSVILETGSMVYFDEATVKDITPDVKTKLGIDPNAKPAQPAQPAQ